MCSYAQSFWSQVKSCRRISLKSRELLPLVKDAGMTAPARLTLIPLHLIPHRRLHHHQTLTAAQVALTAAAAQVKPQSGQLQSTACCPAQLCLKPSFVEARIYVVIWVSCLQAARHRLPQAQTQAPVVTRIQAAQMTAQVAAVAPVVIMEKMSQRLAVTAPTEQHQSIVMFLGIMLTSHTDLSEADERSMPQEAVWSRTVIVIAKTDTAGMMTMIGAVTVGNTQEAIVTGNTPDAVMGKKITE